MEQSAGVWAVMPSPDAAPEVVAAACRLAERLAPATQPARRPQIVLYPDGPPALVAAVLASLAGERRPRAVLLPDSAAGRHLAARLAARLGAGLATACRDVEAVAEGAGPEPLRATRSAFVDSASCYLTITSTPAVLTIEPAVAASQEASLPVDITTIPLPHQPDPCPLDPEVLEVWAVDPFEMELEEAEVVVGGGAGGGGPQGFALLGELARRLGGAVGASRVAVDRGWAPYHRQVGQSGRIVTPRLYIACGISGASHHLVGVRDAETVVAINRDPHAPIFRRADLGLVGDVREVVAALIERLDACSARPEAVAGPAGKP